MWWVDEVFEGGGGFGQEGAELPGGGFLDGLEFFGECGCAVCEAGALNFPVDELREKIYLSGRFVPVPLFAAGLFRFIDEKFRQPI